MKVSIPKKLCRRLKFHLLKAGEVEIGGVLMAKQIAPSDFEVVEISIDDKSGGAAHFVRSVEYHTAALEVFFENTSSNYGQFNYLGEWHSHPKFSVFPSEEDCQSMQSLVDGERGIDFAVLLITRLRFWFFLSFSAYVFQMGQPPFQAELCTGGSR